MIPWLHKGAQVGPRVSRAMSYSLAASLVCRPIQLVIDVLVDPSFVPLLYSQPELVSGFCSGKEMIEIWTRT